MALGRCEAAYELTGKPHAIIDCNGQRRKHAIWEGNPAWQHDAHDCITDGPGARLYIKAFVDNRMIYQEGVRPRAGKVHLTDVEKNYYEVSKPYWLIEPNIKPSASPNKQWGFDRWQTVVDAFPQVTFYQMQGDGARPWLNGVKRLATPTIRHAASVVAGASLVLTNEGGLHHLAASMGVPAVVIFGGFISPEVTGYSTHVNMASPGEGFCGSWQDCQHCKEAMARITPQMVIEKCSTFL